MPHQPQRASVRFRKKPRASAQRLILQNDYLERNFQFLALARVRACMAQSRGQLLGAFLKPPALPMVIDWIKIRRSFVRAVVR